MDTSWRVFEKYTTCNTKSPTSPKNNYPSKFLTHVNLKLKKNVIIFNLIFQIVYLFLSNIFSSSFFYHYTYLLTSIFILWFDVTVTKMTSTIYNIPVIKSFTLQSNLQMDGRKEESFIHIVYSSYLWKKQTLPSCLPSSSPHRHIVMSTDRGKDLAESSDPAPPSHYESQKRIDWSTFIQFFQNRRSGHVPLSDSNSHLSKHGFVKKKMKRQPKEQQ